MSRSSTPSTRGSTAVRGVAYRARAPLAPDDPKMRALEDLHLRPAQGHAARLPPPLSEALFTAQRRAGGASTPRRSAAGVLDRHPPAGTRSSQSVSWQKSLSQSTAPASGKGSDMESPALVWRPVRLDPELLQARLRRSPI